MEKSIENKNNNFLKEGLKVTISKHHKEYLGTTVPEGYFLQSVNNRIFTKYQFTFQ